MVVQKKYKNRGIHCTRECIFYGWMVGWLDGRMDTFFFFTLRFRLDHIPELREENPRCARNYLYELRNIKQTALHPSTFLLVILNLWSWNSWSDDLGNLISIFFSKKDQRSWSHNLTNCNFCDPWSKKPWSSDFDLSKSYDHVIMIWGKPWSWILRS